MSVALGEQQSPAGEYGRNDKPDRGNSNKAVNDYGTDGAGPLEYPTYDVEAPDAVNAPVYRAYKHENVRNDVCKYHKTNLLANSFCN